MKWLLLIPFALVATSAMADKKTDDEAAEKLLGAMAREAALVRIENAELRRQLLNSKEYADQIAILRRQVDLYVKSDRFEVWSLKQCGWTNAEIFRLLGMGINMDPEQWVTRELKLAEREKWAVPGACARIAHTARAASSK